MFSIINIDNIYKNRNILDMLIREVTLHDSINNSSSYTDHFSWNEQDHQEDQNYFNLNDIINNDQSNDSINENEGNQLEKN